MDFMQTQIGYELGQLARSKLLENTSQEACLFYKEDLCSATGSGFETFQNCIKKGFLYKGHIDVDNAVIVIFEKRS